MSRSAADGVDQTGRTDRSVVGHFDSVDRVVAAVGALTVLALLLRLVDLGGRPFHWAEGRVGYWTLRYLDSGAYQYRPVAGGPFLYLVDRWVFELFGATDASARLVVALVGGCLPLAALLYRSRLRDDETVLLAAVFAFSPTLVYYSRFLRGDVPLATFSFVAVGGVFYALDHDDRRGLYLAAIAAALAAAASGFVVTTLCCVVAAAALVVDHARVARAGRAATVDRAEAAARGIDDWVTPIARSFLLFVAVWVVFFAPRSAPGEGLDPTDPGSWLALVSATLVDPIQRFVGVRVDYRLRYGLGHPLIDFLTGYADLLVTLALPTLALAVFAFAVDRYRPGTRPLVVFFSFWAGLSLFVVPVSAERLAPWITVHTLVPLAVPAAVGVATLLRFGSRAVETRDAGRTLVTVLLVLGVVVHAGSVAAWGTYGESDRDNHLAQFAQPADDLDPLLANASAAIDGASGGAGPDVVYVGERYYTGHGDPRQPPAPDAWGNRLPLPWYFERVGAETSSVRAPDELSGSPPVLVAEPQYRDELRDRFPGYRVDTYRLGLWNREVLVLTRR